MFFGLVLAVAGWLFFLSREILSPFILAAIFAYLLGPAVRFLEEKTKLPKTLAILIVYLGILSVLVFVGIKVGVKLAQEVSDFALEARIFLTDPEAEKAILPEWLSPYSQELITAIRSSINVSSQQVVRFFSGAVSSLLSIFVFLLTLFYFLKDGEKLISRVGFSDALLKIDKVLSNYFLAQFFLVVFMSTVCTIVFSLLGIKYALILGILAGLAELIPIVGPTIAFLSIIFVTLTSGGGNPILVGFIYLLINQLENIIVVPQITGRMVQLHPVVIMASVLIGGNLFGAVGVLIAVPLVAAFKVILEHVKAL